MRTIRYYVINKHTNKAIHTECRHDKAKAFLDSLADKENYCITYKWLSI